MEHDNDPFAQLQVAVREQTQAEQSKRRRRWPFVVGGAAVVIVGLAAGVVLLKDSPAPSAGAITDDTEAEHKPSGNGSWLPTIKSALGAAHEKCTAAVYAQDTNAKSLAEILLEDSYDADEDTISVGGAWEQDDDDAITQFGRIYGRYLDCVLDTVDVPTHVRDHMDHTRALDGTQTDDWDGISARWTYHPDSGVNMTLWR